MTLHRVLLVAALLPLSVASARAQAAADPSGHWEGAIQAPFGEVGIEVDVAKNSKGELVATYSNAKEDLKGYPLANVAVDGKTIGFELRATSGGGAFKGTLFSDGKSMSGDFTIQGFNVPFHLSRTGDARIEAAPKSAAIGKELEGNWKATLDVNGRALELGLKMFNQPDGTATGSVLTDLGLEFPIAMTQRESGLTFEVKATGGTYSGALNPQATELVGTYTEKSFVNSLTFRRAPATEPQGR